MPLKVRCPACGKSVRVPESDAGLAAICAACGTQYTIPDDAPPAGAFSAAAPAVSAAPRRLPGLGVWLVLLLAVGAAGLAVVLQVRRAGSEGAPAANADPAPATDAPRRDVVATLKAEAEARAVDGDLKGAHRKYQDLQRLVAGRPIADPETRRLVEAARSEQAKVFAVLVERQRPPPPADPPPAVGAAAADDEPVSQPPAPETADNNNAAAQAPPAPTDPAAPTPAGAGVTPSAIDPASASASVGSPAGPPAATTATTRPATVPGRRPPLRPMPETAGAAGVTDEQIGRAIQAGVDHLLSKFDPVTRSLRDVGPLREADAGGRNALAVYALMQAGRSVPDARLDIRGPTMDRMITAMKRAQLNEGNPQTYARAVRATALALFDRPQDRTVLAGDVAYLLKSHHRGAYTYSHSPFPPAVTGAWDNSNSQYGLLGVWSGAEAGVSVPAAYWTAVQRHWITHQLPDGTWAYRTETNGQLSMTVAGVASLFVTSDWLRGPRSSEAVGRAPFMASLARGLAWLESGNHAVDLTGAGWWGYTLYGVERVGLASGFKYFGEHDWYRALAQQVLSRQGPDGSWGDDVETSFALLFLARGRHPILMNKLRFDRGAAGEADGGAAGQGQGDAPARAPGATEGFWANRPRDVANLARYAAGQLERELNWQVVPLARDYTDWLDSPILYLASHTPPALTTDDRDKIRKFVEAGGLLFTQADGDAAAFNTFAEQLARDLFPRYEMKRVAADHEVYRVVFKVDAAQAPLRAVGNGSRLLMVHSPTDIAKSWQARDQIVKRHLFQLGTNLFVYAAGKRDLRNRLQSPHVSDPGPAPNGSVTVARLRYAANWDPEPGAWPRFANWFQRQTGTGVALKEVKLADLRPGGAAVAHLTGTGRWEFTEPERRAMRDYVEAGGVLLVDACGGTGGFGPSARVDLLPKAFPGHPPARIGPGHPLLDDGPPGMEDVGRPRLRSYTVERFDAGAGGLSLLSPGKGHVLFTDLDVTSGLLGSNTWGVAGYEPGYCQSLVKNLLLWTLDGQPDRGR